MISLTIVHSGGTVTIPDTGSSGYVLVALSPGAKQRENSYAESRWIDGAALTSSRTTLVSMSATVRVIGTTTGHVFQQIDSLGSAVNEWEYTVTATYTGGSAVYYAMPASYSVDYDPNLLRNRQALMTLSIPVAPS